MSTAPSAKDKEIARLREALDRVIEENEALQKTRQCLIRMVRRLKDGKPVKAA